MPPQQAAPAPELQHGLILRRAVIAAACAALGIGVGVMLAWTAHSIWPLPALPFVFEVKFNGALAFTAGAIGLWAILGGRRRLAQTSGLFMVLLSGANILEYLTGLGLGVDQAIVTDFYAAGRPYPGRLYPIACLAFLSMGTALLLACGSRRLPAIRLGALEFLGFLVFSLGVAGLLGHMQPGELLGAWARFTQAPMMACAGFLVMGIGVMALAGLRRGRRVSLWVPGMVCLLVLVLDLGTPRGLVAGIAYIPLIYCSQWFARPRSAFYFALTGTLFTAFAFAVNAPGTAALWVAAVNRCLTIGVLWIIASLVYRRRISERALRQSEIQEAAMKSERDAQTALLAAIVQSSDDAILSMRLDGTVLTWNQAAEKLFGFAAGEMIGQSVGLLIPQPLRSEVDFIVGQLASGSPVENFESLRFHKSGREIPVSLTVSPIRDERGELIGASGILRDITARRVIEKNNALLTAAIVASSDDAIVSEGMSGLITSWTAGAERLFGFDFAAAIGQPMGILIPEEKREEADLILAKLRNGETIQQLESVRMRRDGIGMEVSLTLSPIHDLEGRVLGVSHILRDITDRKRAEEESLRSTQALMRTNRELDELAGRLKDGEARLKAILDSVVDGIVTIDSKGTIITINPAAARMFEYQDSDVGGQNIRMLMPEPDRSAHDGYLARHQSTGKSTAIGVGRELEGLSRTGRKFPIELTVTELTLQGQRFFVGLIRDTTERSRQEKALRESKELLERAGRLAGVGGWYIDFEANQVVWAAETYRILGADPSYRPTIEEGIGLYTPESRPLIAAALQKASADGQEIDLEASLIGLDGRLIWARVVGVVEFAGGRPARVAGAFHDITARVAERQALREANERAAMAAESCGIGIWDWDLRSDKFSCDALLHRIFGLEPGSAKQFGLAFWAGRVHPGDRSAVEKALKNGIAGIKAYDAEFRIVWEDGSIHHVMATGKVTRDRDGNAIRMVGTNMDITERVLEREALKEANERAALAAESGGIGIWYVDLRAGTVNYDSTMYRIYGLDPECGIQAGVDFWMGHLHPEDRSAVEQAFQDGIAGIRPYDTEFRIVWDDGSIHHIRATGKVTRDKDGVPIRMVGTNMDITARILEREALKDANERAALAAESGGIGIFDWDMKNNRLTSDRLIYEIYGVDADGPVRIDFDYWKDHLHPEDRPAVERALQDAAAGTRPYLEDFRILWPDGSIRHMRATGSVTRDRDGNAIRMVGTNMDITERKRAEEESQRMMEALRRSNKELDEFAYAASHDLKAPLRVIDNASKWLQEDLEPHLTAETRENMNLLRGRVARMEKLLDDLLEYSRIGRKTDKRGAETLSGDLLMEEILDMLSPPAGFTVDVSSSLAGIEVNRMPLQQVLINLVSNAIKHHDKAAGRIEVSVADQGDCLEFTVRDDGPGIPPPYHAQVFDMFQTLRPRDQVEGSGMGLAMVRKYIEVSGGKIAIESGGGRGSAFRFTWPKSAQLQEARR